MKLSGTNRTKRAWPSQSGDTGQLAEDGAKVEASVEQILDLPEIAMRLLVVCERVVRSGQGGLEVAQGGVDGHEQKCLTLSAPPPVMCCSPRGNMTCCTYR